MERTNYQASNCSIGRTLQVVGEKWTLLILRESFYGATRFEQFHSVLQCPRNLLSERLAKLVEEGILERSEYREPGSRARHEYRMTDLGRELVPILLALREWGDRHKADPEGPPVLTRHAGCGKRAARHAHVRKRPSRGRAGRHRARRRSGRASASPGVRCARGSRSPRCNCC